MKDKNNLLDYNQWTLGEYEPSSIVVTNATNAKAYLTYEYSHIGEKSLKITQLANGGYAFINYNENKKNKTLTATTYINTNNSKVYFLLVELVNGHVVQSPYIVIPPNSEGLYSISLITGNEDNKLRMQVNLYGENNNHIFQDSLKLTLQ